MTQSPARYEEIVGYLRALVADNEPGDRLPSDTELCARFGVSRMTARQAVQVLAGEHLLHRVRGRGTFVSARPVPRLLGSPLSFTASMRRRGLVASSRVLWSGRTAAMVEDAAALGIDPEAEVGVLERLRLADEVPMAIERAVITPSCSAVLDDLGDGSLHAAFERLGRIPTTAHARVSARRVDERDRSLLDMAEGDVLLVERRIIFDQDGVALEHTETRYVAERYAFDAVMHRGDDG